MPIDKEKIAQRMLHFRKTLGISQSELAKEIKAPHQNTISFLETKSQYSVETFFNLVNFFSRYFYMDNLLSDHFTVVKITEEEERTSLHNAITSKLLLEFKKNMNLEIDKIKDSIHSSEEDF